MNIAAAWFIAVFIETQAIKIDTFFDVGVLILKLILGMMSLLTAKYFRDKSRRKK